MISLPEYQFPVLMNGLTTIKREALSPSPTNPRKNFNPEKLKELAETIKVHGILEPLLVRGLGNGRYEIVATTATRSERATVEIKASPDGLCRLGDIRLLAER